MFRLACGTSGKPGLKTRSRACQGLPLQEALMAIYELDGQAPDLPADGNYFIADTAAVIG